MKPLALVEEVPRTEQTEMSVKAATRQQDFGVWLAVQAQMPLRRYKVPKLKPDEEDTAEAAEEVLRHRGPKLMAKVGALTTSAQAAQAASAVQAVRAATV